MSLRGCELPAAARDGWRSPNFPTHRTRNAITGAAERSMDDAAPVLPGNYLESLFLDMNGDFPFAT